MRRLLVALKERAEAERMAALAAKLSQEGVMVHVVRVAEHDFADADATVRAAVELLERDHLTAIGHVEPALDGAVATSIARRAIEVQAEVIVMGSRGLSHVGGLFGRSVSHTLMAATDLPVLVIPAGALIPRDGFRRVLVALSDASEAQAAIGAVGLLEAPLEVLAVHVPRIVAIHHGKGGFVETPESSMTVLSQAGKRFGEVGIRIAIRTLPPSGDAAASLTGLAHDWSADLLLLCSRRLGDWEALFAGSTAHAVFRMSDRPVLIAGRMHDSVELDRPGDSSAN